MNSRDSHTLALTTALSTNVGLEKFILDSLLDGYRVRMAATRVGVNWIDTA